MKNRKTNWLGAAALICAVAVFVGVAWAQEGSDTQGLTKAVCVLTPTEGSEVRGTVTFTQQKDGVQIEAHVWGLKPNAKHGFHIHEFGDISSSDGKSTGGHFNPDGHDHSGPGKTMRHVGDLGNLESDGNGHAMYKRVDKYVQIHGAHTILSRGMVIHAGEDDMKTQPTGAAGARLAVGVIGLAKAE